jgi:hypothetical protein
MKQQSEVLNEKVIDFYCYLISFQQIQIWTNEFEDRIDIQVKLDFSFVTK